MHLGLLGDALATSVQVFRVFDAKTRHRQGEDSSGGNGTSGAHNAGRGEDKFGSAAERNVSGETCVPVAHLGSTIWSQRVAACLEDHSGTRLRWRQRRTDPGVNGGYA